jgi:hypothetical protein
MSDDRTNKFFRISIDIGVPTLIEDFDFNEFDDPEKNQAELNKEYGNADKAELVNHMELNLGIGTDGDLDDPDCLGLIRWEEPTLSMAMEIDPFSLQLTFYLSCEMANTLISAGEDDMHSEILHCLEISSQMPKHNVTLGYYNTHEIEEISEEEFDKIAYG